MSIPYADHDDECTGEIGVVHCESPAVIYGSRPRIWRVGNTNGFAGGQSVRRRGRAARLPETVPTHPTHMPVDLPNPAGTTPGGGPSGTPDPTWPDIGGTPHTEVHAKTPDWRSGGVISKVGGGYPRWTATRNGETRTNPSFPGGPTHQHPKNSDDKTLIGGTNPSRPTTSTPNAGNPPTFFNPKSTK